ncbi:MAG: hypothetical protein FOGNACKC_01530 [Anaerolineae bacterium]|nr:hypothetical protein [Anaerolineae bacterium]
MSAKKKLNASLDELFSNSAPQPESTEHPAGADTAAPPAEAASQEPARNGAAAKAKKSAAETSSAADRQLVVFSLANEFYGVDITLVESIVRTERVTVVPHAPQFIDGVINMRGEVLPVIDLSSRFGLPRNEETKDTRIIVIEVNQLRVGMVVDAVTEVLNVSESLIEPPSPLVMTIDSAFVNGIAKVPDRLIILLDLDKIIQVEEAIA